MKVAMQKRWSAGLALVCATFCCSLPLLAQPQATAGNSTPGGKTFSIPRIDLTPEMDGRLDDAVWQQAALIDDFHQLNPLEYTAPTQRTEVRIFYNEDSLYVGARMYEEDPSLISANVMQQGQGLLSDDLFDLILNPNGDRRSGYDFLINPYGIRLGGIFQDVTRIDRNWNGIWMARSNIDDQGWTTEVRIPFQTISFDPANPDWGINFRRAIRRNNEDMGWVSRNRLVNPSISGMATGFVGLEQGLGLDVVPYIVARQERVFGPQGLVERDVEPQLDMFYKVTPQLNAALTLNTDFSATEVDNRQVNLTRFSLFFPERRDFFTRDSDIFQFGKIGASVPFAQERNIAVPNAARQNGRPYFSRRIGLSRSGQPVDVNVGARLSGRIGNWNVGSLVVNQGEDELTGLGTQNVFVGRAALNVLSESQVGVIGTWGNPQTGVDNWLTGTDFRYRNSRLPGGRVLESEVWYQQTDSPGIGAEDAAYGFGISSPNSNGWRGEYAYKRIENNFNPAAGFVNQRGIDDHALDIGYRKLLSASRQLRAFYGGFDGYRNSDINTGELISQIMDLRASVDRNSGDKLSVSIIRNREVISRNFNIHTAPDNSRVITILPGDYAFMQGSVDFTFAPQRKLTGGLSVVWGDYYDGTNLQRSADVTWRYSPRFSVSTSYTENEIKLPQGNFTVRLLSANTVVNFSAMLSWSNRIQYDNVSESLGINSRLYWIPEAGREVYLVLNWGMADMDRDNSFNSLNADLSLKFNYTLRF